MTTRDRIVDGNAQPIQSFTTPEPWESWGIAARWNPQHHWHAPDEQQ